MVPAGSASRLPSSAASLMSGDATGGGPPFSCSVVAEPLLTLSKLQTQSLLSYNVAQGCCEVVMGGSGA